MLESEFEVWLSIGRPLFGLCHAPTKADYEESIEDFVGALRNFMVAKHANDVTSVRAQLRRPTSRVLRDFQKGEDNRFLLQGHSDFAQLRCKVRIDPAPIRCQNPDHELTDHQILSLFASVLPDSIEDAVLLACLAYPGRIPLVTCIVYRDGQFSKLKQHSSGFYTELLEGNESKWPHIAKLDFESVCNWEKSIGLFDTEIARTPIQRALASFTHACKLQIPSEELLFWSMQGLESFYCRGTGDLRNQLAEKVKIFLGPWEVDKNLVGHLYDFRSKFVHGSFNLMIRNNTCEVSETDRKGQHLLVNVAYKSAAILVCTLQECVRQNVSTVDWGYSLEVK